MADPLTIKQPSSTSHFKQYVLLGVLFLPLVYLRYLKRNGGLIHFNSPALNIAAHALIVLLPLGIACVMMYKPFDFRESSETILEPQSFWALFKYNWWMFLLLLASPLFAVLALLYEAPRLGVTGAAWMTGPGSAVLSAALAFAFGIVFGAVLGGSSQTRISEEGLRNGLVHFYEWESINHVSVENDVLGIYHRANPALPMTYFRLKQAENRRLLESYLAKHEVWQTHEPEPGLFSAKIAVVAATFLITAAGFWLYLTTVIDLRWLLLGVFAVSIGATMLLESVRGLSKVTKTKPLVEPEGMADEPEQNIFKRSE